MARGYATPEQFARLPIVPARAVSQTQTSAAVGGTASVAGAPQGVTRDVTSASSSQGYITRLGDIARVEEAADDVARAAHHERRMGNEEKANAAWNCGNSYAIDKNHLALNTQADSVISADLNHTVRFCYLGDRCVGDALPDRNVFTASYIIAGNSTYFKPAQILLHIWR